MNPGSNGTPIQNTGPGGVAPVSNYPSNTVPTANRVMTATTTPQRTIPTAAPSMSGASPSTAQAAKTPVSTGTLPRPLSTPGGPKPPGSQLPSSSAPGDLRILTRQKLSELAKQIDGEDRLDDDAVRIMMLLADEFVDSVTTFACRLAKHRKSQTVEVKDVQMHLERNWNIRIAGVGGDDDLPPSRGRKRPLESHKQRLAIVKKSKK